MSKGKFNWAAVVVLIISLAVLAISAFGLRKWQLNRRGAESLKAGLEAYDNHSWQAAATNLGKFIAINQSDVPILLKYADAQLRIRPLKRNNIQQAIAAYRSVLRFENDNSAAARKLVNLYIELDIATEAELIAERYLQTNKSPEIATIRAISLSRQRKNNQAVSLLRKIIDEYPRHIPAYQAMAQISEKLTETGSESAEYWFDEAIKSNPDSADAYILRAGSLLEKHETTKALQDLEKAQKLDLSDPAVRLRIARELANANMFDDALSHLEQLRRQNPTELELWQSWAMVAIKTNSAEQMQAVAEEGLKELSAEPWDFMPVAAELFIRSGRTDLAAEYIEKLKQKGIAPAVTVFLEGLLAGARRQDHKTVQAWHRAIQLGDNSARTRLALAKALSLYGDDQSAILHLRRLISEQPDLLEAHLELSRLLTETGNWPRVARQARMALDVSPDSFDAVLIYLRAQIELLSADGSAAEAGAWERIEEKLNELEQLTSGSQEILLLKFHAELRQKNYTAAEELLARLEAKDDKKLEIEFARVELLTAQDNIDQAVSKLYNVLEDFPESTAPVMYLANLLNLHRDRGECEKMLTAAITGSANPYRKRDLGIALARYYNLWQQNDKAVELLSELSEQLPYDIPVRWELLKYDRVKQDTTLAQEIVDQIKALEGEHGWQWRCAQAGIWLGDDKFEGYYPQIVELLKENIVENPDDQISRMLLAQAYEKAGELHLAVATYREALNRSPEDIRIIVSAVSAMYKAKEYEQADAILNRLANEKLNDPRLSILELQSHIRQGRIGSAETVLEDLMARDPNDNQVSLSLALLKIRRGKYDQAGELLDKLRLLEPQNVSVIAAMVDLNLRRENPDQALALCNQAIENSGSASAYIIRARTYFLLDKKDLAGADFERAAAIEPDSVQPWISKSDFNRAVGRFEAAIEDIQKALEIAPANINIQKRAITLLLSSPEREKMNLGSQLLEEAHAANPYDIDLKLYKANLLLARGTSPEISEAAEILQTIVRETPKTPEAWALLAQIYLSASQPAKAMDTLLHALAYSPENKQLLLLKARTEAATAPELAIPALKALYRSEPADIRIALELAETCIAAGRNAESASVLTDLLDRCDQKERRKVDIALATALYKAGQKNQAQERFEKLYQLAPEEPDAPLAHAKCLIEDTRWQKLTEKINRLQQRTDNVAVLTAIANQLVAAGNSDGLVIAENLLRNILKNNPDTAQAMFTLAMLLQITGRVDESAGLYERILETDPDAVVAINNLAWIMCENHGEYEKARQLAQQGLKKAPDYIDLVDTHGVISYRLGNYRRAAKDFERCVRLYPQGSPALAGSYFHLARTLAAMKNNSGALENLRMALKLSSQNGGLSQSQITESQNLLKQLSREESYAKPVSR